jgi:hypothetical protein
MVDKSSNPLKFGIENDQDNYNCFLNVCLQTLWQVKSIRLTLRELCTEEDSIIPYEEPVHRNLVGFIRSLKNFYRPLFDQDSSGSEMKILCSKEIRTELFISSYLSKSFDIYD